MTLLINLAGFSAFSGKDDDFMILAGDTMNKLVACSTDAKRCARQMVTSAFNEILCGNFRIPSLEEMQRSVESFIDYTFDEHQVMSKVVSKHPGWDEERVKGDVLRKKMKYDKEYRNNIKQAASESITEIENLISSLNDTIKSWKIRNLE
jgi:hypothetical protein